MTVSELIDALQKIEDQNKEVLIEVEYRYSAPWEIFESSDGFVMLADNNPLC